MLSMAFALKWLARPAAPSRAARGGLPSRSQTPFGW